MQGNDRQEIRSARFLVSSPDIGSCPAGGLPEYAFIGRSNVGKSSLINMLTGTRGLAKISQTPGKTRLINHFIINDEWHLVDLPGYGYAKISQQERNRWKKMIHAYLLGRKTLVCTFILIDTRHEPQRIDLDFMAWMAENRLPFVLAFTKTDKLSKTGLAGAVKDYCDELLLSWEELPAYFVTSARTGAGREAMLAFIAENNLLYREYLGMK